MNYINTINHDLHCIKKLISFRSNPNYSCIHIYSLLRDSCLIIYEIIKLLKKERILEEYPTLYSKIESIRHKIKSSQGCNNKETFSNVLDTHFYLFGEDIDNIGFYLDKKELIGSTVYATYIFNGTPYLDSNNNNRAIKEFSKEIGQAIGIILTAINQTTLIPSLDTLDINESAYKQKDVWHKRLFTEDLTYNVCLMRLLVIQNEISDCIWLKNHLNYKTQEFTIDKYLLLRLSSIRLYQTMENIIDIKKRASHHYTTLKLNELEELTIRYNKDLRVECKTLRDMLHYNNHQINFFEYVTKSFEENELYVDNILRKILTDYLPTLKETISKSLDIHSRKSMSELEKIIRRIHTNIMK